MTELPPPPPCSIPMLPDGRRPHVLLSNDDGIEAEGLRALAEALEPHVDLTIVAPSHENSGMGHAITVFRDLHFETRHRAGRMWGWGLNGTPADCVKVACALLGRDRPFDAVISGINRGQNAGINVLYSGTVAAAREGAMLGLPAIAMSLLYHDETHLPYETPARVAVDVLARLLADPLPRGTMLNVNVPPVPYEALRGWRVTRMGDSGYLDFFQPQAAAAAPATGVAPQSGIDTAAGLATPATPPASVAVECRPGVYRNIGKGWQGSRVEAEDLDDVAIYADMVSITPLQFDLTAYEVLPQLHGWFGNGHAR